MLARALRIGRQACRGAVGLALLSIMMASGCKGKAVTESAPPEVTVATPQMQIVTNYLDFTGNTASVDSVSLVARVEGYLDKIHFIDGQAVKKSQLLFTIQQSQYQAQLEQAQAQVAAQKAAVWHATTELARYSRLLKKDATTQTEVD